MCGILACLGAYKGAEEAKTDVLVRARRLRHRGPDWSGCYSKGKNIIAHERLAIVGVESGSQPLISKDGERILAVNGEIYNHVQLRKQLKNQADFQTKSDCEVILHMGSEMTPMELCGKLNGIWAFVLLNEKTGNYIVARDHCGIIPLYWGRDVDGALWVASELKALHDICVTFEDFPPGHFYDSSTGETVKYYNPKWHDETYMPKQPVVLKELHDSLVASVHRQLMADVPFGVLLSGGLDSSVISAVAAKYCKSKSESKEAGWMGGRLHSFSIGLDGSPDLAAARKVADHIDTIHHEFKFTVEEGLNALSDVIYHLETYDVTTCRAATPMYLMSRKIKALGVKMVLSGEGADEIFGGYLYFHKAPSKEDMQAELSRKVKGMYKFDNLRANKSTSAWGVEARVPFLDKEFMDYALNDIDPADKMCGVHADGRIEKWIVRKAFEDYLPEEVLWRQKEQFSDGVGYSWIDSIKEFAASKVTDSELANAKYRFPHNPPPTKEAYFIRSTFASHFPEASAALCVPGGPSVACSSPTAVLWDESFKKFADCSGRSVAGVHNSAYDDKHKEAFSESAVNEETVANSDVTFCTTIKSEGKSSSEPATKKARKA